MPLSTIRRVERLNARAGIYALSLITWHSMKLVSSLWISYSEAGMPREFGLY